MITITEKQRQLVTDNHNLIYSFLHTHNFSIDDYYDVAAIGLCNAAISYNPLKSSFSTYAYRCISNTVYSQIRKDSSMKNKPQDSVLSIEYLYNGQCCIENLLNKSVFEDSFENEYEVKVIFTDYYHCLSKIDKQIIQLYSQGLTQNNISQIVGRSRKYINQLKQKTKKYIISEINLNLG